MQAESDIAFGRFRLDLTNECLWHGTQAISLRPKAFALLKLLLEHPGSLVTKQQMLDSVWPETFVGDAVLKDNIRQLREALEDDAESPSYIETAHRRGYRFIGKLSHPIPIKDVTVGSVQARVSKLSSETSATTSRSAIGVLGRDTELAKMRECLDRALAGTRQIIFVTGEPGIGKTALVDAFARSIASGRDTRIVRGQCLE